MQRSNTQYDLSRVPLVLSRATKETRLNSKNPLLGIVLVICAVACFAVLDTSVRYVGSFFPIALVLWVRYGLHTVIMTMYISVSTGHSFRTDRPMFQMSRGALLAFASTMSFAALQRMPVAAFTSIILLAPVFVTIFARVWLKENVSLLRWALVIGSFIGALIVIRPSTGIVGWPAILPLIVAISSAGFQIMTSRFGGDEDPFTTNFYTGVIGVALATPLLLSSAIDPWTLLSNAGANQLFALFCVAALGTSGHLLLIMALGKAPASTLMPFQYAQLGFAALTGYIVFNSVPDALGWVGMSVIALCGAASAWLNVRKVTTYH